MRFCTLFLLALGCAHCGTAYTYVPSPTSSDTSPSGSTSGSGSTTSSSGGGQAGGTTGSAGGTSSGGTTGVAVSLLSLEVDGDGFNNQGFRGNMVDQAVSAQILLGDSNQKVGNVMTGSVQDNGTFTLDFNAVLNPNTAYDVALYVDLDHNGQCEERDTQSLVGIPPQSQDAAVEVSRNMQQASVCDDF